MNYGAYYQYYASLPLTDNGVYSALQAVKHVVTLRDVGYRVHRRLKTIKRRQAQRTCRTAVRSRC